MIETLLDLLQKSSEIFGYLQKSVVNYLGNVQKCVSFKKLLGESSEIFGKWLEIFGKSSKIMLYVIRIFVMKIKDMVAWRY